MDTALHSVTTQTSGIPVTASSLTGPLYYWAIANEHAQQHEVAVPLEHSTTPVLGAVHANEILQSESHAVVLVEFPHDIETTPLAQLETLVAEHRSTIWIALLPTNWQNHKRLCQLITQGFFDYHQLPVEAERLRIIIGHAFGMLSLSQRVDEQQQHHGEQDLLIGNSDPMQCLKRHISKVAKTQGTVLINGESGTGKELVAKEIHQLSNRHNARYEALNCAALPANLIQSELFGHERGAYTDAHRSKPGRFESSNGGTLFLDEIGDMPLEQQVNLLRVLEQGCLRRVGGNRDIPIDVRIVTATHIDLEQAVTEGHFREDLYYRLNVLKIDVPALRERNGDIELLARYFFRRFQKQSNLTPSGFSREAVEAMRGYHWPGNVRELINRVQHATIMAEGKLIQRHDLGIERRETRRQRLTLKTAREQAERQAINDALHLCQHNVSEAARELGVSRVALYRLLDKHHIPPR